VRKLVASTAWGSSTVELVLRRPDVVQRRGTWAGGPEADDFGHELAPEAVRVTFRVRVPDAPPSAPPRRKPRATLNAA
jgi:hypothetical protein